MDDLGEQKANNKAGEPIKKSKMMISNAREEIMNISTNQTIKFADKIKNKGTDKSGEDTQKESDPKSNRVDEIEE